ncbi:hypothetical protein Tsubulata_050554 [Turnera subulata]|uniref:DUF4283 domain-containing protein n=1 Tax=Turnera subulata TaxID=218843 RepID=A0A9Q0F1M8_9ROSI|nr:hypothetical protein Tsubulata_050554 [Turnera subulata]
MAASNRLVIDLGANREPYEVSEEQTLGELVARTYVVGKIFSDRCVSPSQIYNQMRQIWYIKGEFRVIPKPANVFLIGFELEEDRKHVLKGSPWLVSNLHFCLKPWTDSLILSQVPLRLSHFWVQIHDIPLDLLSRACISRIGKAFPVFLHYEQSLENILGWKGFVRAHIEFDVTQPLRPDVHVLDMAGQEIWIKFRYKRLGEFCTRCGLISHAIYKCKQPKRLNEGEELPEENSFGPWMRAKEIYGKHYSGMKSFDTARPLASDSNMTPEDASNLEDSKAADTPIADQVGRSSTVKLGKRKAATDPTILPIHESARKLHTDLMQAVVEIVEETDNHTPVHASASKPKWKRLARETVIIPTLSADEWVEAYERGECPSDGMGVVMPLPRGDPREPADPPAGYPLQ